MSDLPAATGQQDALIITLPILSTPRKAKGNEEEQISSAYPFDGLIWSVHVKKGIQSGRRVLMVSVHCKGDEFSELWRTKAELEMSYEHKHGVSPITVKKVSRLMVSWKEEGHKFDLMTIPNMSKAPTTSISVTINTKNESFARRSNPDPTWSIHDVIIVLKGTKFPVNKQELANQSSYFNGLFFGNFKESNQEEIEIKGFDPEDFDELLKMVRGLSTEPTTVKNAKRYLRMAEFFDIQFVKCRMENFLHTTRLISMHRKFLIAHQYNLETLKTKLLLLYKKPRNLWNLRKSHAFAEFPASLVKNVLFHNACDLI